MVKRSEESLVKLATLLIGILGVTALASSLAWGQGFSAEISGVVRDASGAVIPGVSVSAKHIESGLTRTVNTGDSGDYSIPSLSVGAGQLTAGSAGLHEQL